MNQLGGLSRKYTKIEELRSANETLLVDSGNSLFESDKTFAISPVELSKAKGIAQIYSAMDYDAINIGSYDLVAGIPFIQELSFLPWVSANFYDASGQPFFQPYIIKSIIDLNVGIIGLSPDTDQNTDHIQYRPWQEVLPSLLAELEKKTDVIIILSSLAMSENQSIALNFPSIRIIFTAVPGGRSVTIHKENNALLTQTMDRGRYLGYLFLQNPQISKWQERTTAANERNQKRTLKYRLQRVDTILLRQENMPERNRNELLKEKKKLELQLKNWQHQKERVTASYFYRNIPILQNFKQDEDIQRLLESVKKEMGNVKTGK